MPGQAGAEAVAAIEGAGAVLVSDYGQGTAAGRGLRDALAARSQQVPLVWDPHPRGAAPVPGTWLVTPNQAEALAASRRRGAADTPGTGDGQSADSGPGREEHRDVFRTAAVTAERLLGHWPARAVAVTLGPRGALLSEAVTWAVDTASRYVAAGGVSALDRVDGAPGGPAATSGCFDVLHAGHVSMLRAARALGDALVVCVNSDASVRRLKGAGRPLNPAADRVAVLRALDCVDDVVIFDEDTPGQLLTRLRPDIWVKGGDYDGQELPEAAVLRRWGGLTVTVPYLDGRSTTRIAAAAAGLAGT